MTSQISMGTIFPFLIRDCVFATIATGHIAHTLIELRDCLKSISPRSIYHHFWREAIATRLASGAYYNDFSHWAHYDLHDDFLAERLTLLNPTEYPNLENLREDMLEIIETRIDEKGNGAFSLQAIPFFFLESNIVIFNTTYKLENPKDLVKTLPEISKSSIFYHFIDARRRQPSRKDDFSAWLEGYGDQYNPLIACFQQIDPYFISLEDLQHKLVDVVAKYFLEGDLSCMSR
jgi:septum formation topological specificity factor MinE